MIGDRQLNQVGHSISFSVLAFNGGLSIEHQYWRQVNKNTRNKTAGRKQFTCRRTQPIQMAEKMKPIDDFPIFRNATC
jgi:hypothetical protein